MAKLEDEMKIIEEKIEENENKINDLSHQKILLENKYKKEERKKRTHRLIQVGAATEKVFGEIPDVDVYLQCLYQNYDRINSSLKYFRNQNINQK